MTSPATTISNSNQAQQSASTASPTAATGTTPAPGRSSYANATKGKPASPTAVPTNTPPAQAGASTQNAMSSSISPVNGNKPVQPAVPAMSGPAIVNSSANGAPTPSEHTRKPSAVTISASGASYGMPNGTSAPSRPNINFGSMNAGGSPAISNSVPHNPHGSLGTPMQNPQPARSPSPIPQPTASGGRPPTGLTGPSQLNFGTLPGGDGVDATSRLPLPQGPAAQIAGGQHLRRESSQSGHNSDMSPAMNRSFMPNGRGQPFRPVSYQNPTMPHSPQPFRPNVAQGRGNPPNMPMYPQQGRMPNSPYTNRPTPAVPGNAMPQQPHWASAPGMQYGVPGYPQQFGSPQNPQAMYGMPQQMDPNFQATYGYNPQAYQQQLYPTMQYPGAAPPSPRNYPPAQPSYSQGYNPQGMSRQSSQGPERPASVGQPSTPGIPTTQATPTPGPASSSPGPTQQFQPPKRGSKAIQIKRPDGTEVTIDKLTSPPPAQPNRGPTVISSATGTPSSSTPPPQRNASVSAPTHTRSDSQTTKSAAEKAAEFREQFQRQLAAEQEEEKRQKEAEEKAAKEKEAKEKEEADRKAREAKEAEEAAKAAKEKEEAEKAAAEAKAKEEEAAEKARKEAEEKKRQEDEEMERWIAEMEAKEKEEEEKQRKYEEEKKKRQEEEKARKAKEPSDEDLRQQEREAEEAELAKEKASKAADEESAKLFASLKRPTLGPGATASESGASTPAAADSPKPQPAQPTLTQPKTTTPLSGKPKPAALKLETHKPVEPAQPTAGMQSLKSARYLDVKNLDKIYPDGVKSPNPALNATAKGRGRKYDKDFLLQFQSVFKEKPSIEWDKILKDTVGDTSDSARPQSARIASTGGRQNSRPPMGGGIMGGAMQMGSFGAPGHRTLPPGTSSAQRFMASEAQRMGQIGNPFGAFGGRPGSGFPMGAPVMARSGSSHSLAGQGGINSPRTNSSRGNRSRRGGPSAAEEAKLAKTMPLTAGQDLKPLEVSKSGWKPTSIGTANAPALPGGHMAPDMVQRKVKANLNKMTPEKFEKISDDILHIAMQSKDEPDGRTLRQVIQLTFEKACDEAHWASMYAKFCKRMLETMSPEIKDENVRDRQNNPVVGGALFRKYLLNRCQEEFERGWEVNLPEKPEGQTEEAAMLSDEYYVAAAAKRRGLGLIQFIGELYKLDMLTIRIMHECVYRLLNFEGLPDESAIESLVKLLRTVGGKMEESQNGQAMISSYFERIKAVMDQEGLPSRMYYMLLDTVDLRRKGWKSKDDAKGPKTIQEIREDALAAHQAAEAERMRQNIRGGPRPPMGRGDARSFSGGGMMPPPDYHPRNQVGMDDLKKLTRGARQSSQGPTGSLGPSMLGSRSSSGRRGLGPLSRGAEDSNNSSRTGTPPVDKKETTAHINAFSALAHLDASGEDSHDVHSPSPAGSPQISKSQPVVASTSGGKA